MSGKHSDVRGVTGVADALDLISVERGAQDSLVARDTLVLALGHGPIPKYYGQWRVEWCILCHGLPPRKDRNGERGCFVRGVL